MVLKSDFAAMDWLVNHGSPEAYTEAQIERSQALLAAVLGLPIDVEAAEEIGRQGFERRRNGGDEFADDDEFNDDDDYGDWE